MKILLLFFLPFTLVLRLTKGYTEYLSKKQWSHIKHILEHPDSTDTMIQRTRQIIFDKYSKWAINKAYQFSQKYRFHKKMNPKELSNYALFGLHKAILQYNTSYAFFNHVDLYTSSSLFQAITDIQPLNNIPKSLRKSKKWRTDNPILYEKMLKTQFVGPDEWIFDKFQKHEDNEEKDKEFEIWLIVSTMDPLSKKIFTFKYGLNYQYSNKQIGEQLAYSEETIRMNLKKIHKEILLKIDNETKSTY